MALTVASSPQCSATMPSARRASGLSGSLVTATRAAARATGPRRPVMATTSALAPDCEVTTSRVPGVISPGASSSCPLSVHQAGWPASTSRRQPGSAAKWEEPMPVSTMRS